MYVRLYIIYLDMYVIKAFILYAIVDTFFTKTPYKSASGIRPHRIKVEVTVSFYV